MIKSFVQKRNIIPAGIIIGTLLIAIAALFYPGGSTQDLYSDGYHFFQNYISDLLNPLAVNGMHNPARSWAVSGLVLLAISFGYFFIKFPEKIDERGSNTIKYLGILATISALLVIIPSLHDIMVTVSSITTLVIFFYITVFVSKSKASPIIKWVSAGFLVIFYMGAYMYFARFHLEFMPLVQKIIFFVKIVWILILEYGTQTEDFINHDRNPNSGNQSTHI